MEASVKHNIPILAGAGLIAIGALWFFTTDNDATKILPLLLILAGAGLAYLYPYFGPALLPDPLAAVDPEPRRTVHHQRCGGAGIPGVGRAGLRRHATADGDADRAHDGAEPTDGRDAGSYVRGRGTPGVHAPFRAGWDATARAAPGRRRRGQPPCLDRPASIID